MGYSLYLVGSRARGDDNIRSDVDYVCIYERAKPSLNLPIEASVSYYSLPRMNWMVKNSKLFVKHILSEGVTLVENANHASLLNSFKINRDVLLVDLMGFEQSLRNLTWIPDGLVGRRWACDYIFTLARNVIYISNALDEYYDFGYKSAVCFFLEKRNLTRLTGDFLQLRNEKYKFRAGEQGGSSVDCTFLEIIIGALTATPSKILIGGYSSFSAVRYGSYEFLRLVERGVINGEFRDNGYLEKLKNHGEYFFLLRNLACSLVSDANKQTGLSPVLNELQICHS